MCSECRIYLTQLDAEATNLHLEIAAADVLDLESVITPDPPDDVAGAVHPRTRLAVGVGDEPVSGQRRPAVIPTRHRRPTEVELAVDSDGNRLQAVVEDQRRQAADRRTDGDAFTRLHGSGYVGETCCLGGAVAVEHAAAWCPAIDQLRRARLAADDNRFECVESGRIHRGQCCRSDEAVGDPVLGQEVVQFVAAVYLGRRDHHGRAVGEREQHLQHGGVEARRREVQCARVLGQDKTIRLFVQQVRETTVGDGHTLGHSRGSRGVDHVRRVGHADRCDAFAVAQHGSRLFCDHGDGLVRIELKPLDGVGTFCTPRRGGQAVHRRGVTQHVLDAFGRVAHVHRQVTRPGLGDRPQPHHEVDGAAHAQSDDLFRPDPPGDQKTRKGIRSLVQLAVGDRPGRRDRGIAFTRRCHRCVEEFRQRREAGGSDTALTQQFGTLVGIEDVDIADTHTGVGSNLSEHPDHHVQDRFGLLALHDAREVLRRQPQTRIGHGDQGQRVVRGVEDICVVDPHPVDVRSCGQRSPVEWVGLVDHHGVEQRIDICLAQDLGEADRVMVEQLGLFLRNTFDQPAEVGGRFELDPHGQGVDEQAEHRFDAGHLRRPSRHRGPEDDVVAAGQAGEHQRPSGLEDVVDGHPGFTDELGQPRRQRLVEHDIHLTRHLTCAVGVGAREEQGRFVDTAESARPRGQRLLR